MTWKDTGGGGKELVGTGTNAGVLGEGGRRTTVVDEGAFIEVKLGDSGRMCRNALRLKDVSPESEVDLTDAVVVCDRSLDDTQFKKDFLGGREGSGGDEERL